MLTRNLMEPLSKSIFGQTTWSMDNTAYNIDTHICTCLHIYIYTDLYIYACMNVCMSVYACMHACMHACMYVCMYVGR